MAGEGEVRWKVDESRNGKDEVGEQERWTGKGRRGEVGRRDEEGRRQEVKWGGEMECEGKGRRSGEERKMKWEGEESLCGKERSVKGGRRE